MSTESTLTEMITESRGLFSILWPVALGEPVYPDGEVCEYGDERLAEMLLEVFYGETQHWPADVARYVSLNRRLWTKGSILTLAEVENLGDDGWERVCEAVIKARPEREIACRYCREILPATEDDFRRHYRQTKCWDS